MPVRKLFVFMRSIYGLPEGNRHGAWVGFSVPAAEVIGTPSFEGYDRFPKPDHGFESAILGLNVA